MIAGLTVWDLAAIATGVALIATALRYRPRTNAAVEPLVDDYPTTPIPVIPPVPAAEVPAVGPVLETRLMLRRDELLWAKSDPDDPEGIITLGLLSEAGGQLGVLVDDNGIAIGLRLDRVEVQSLRDAITNHLVASSKPVRP